MKEISTSGIESTRWHTWQGAPSSCWSSSRLTIASLTSAVVRSRIARAFLNSASSHCSRRLTARRFRDPCARSARGQLVGWLGGVSIISCRPLLLAGRLSGDGCIRVTCRFWALKLTSYVQHYIYVQLCTIIYKYFPFLLRVLTFILEGGGGGGVMILTPCSWERLNPFLMNK